MLPYEGGVRQADEAVERALAPLEAAEPERLQVGVFARADEDPHEYDALGQYLGIGANTVNATFLPGCFGVPRLVGRGGRVGGELLGHLKY